MKNNAISLLSEMFDDINHSKDLFDILDSLFKIPISIIITDANARIVFINQDYSKFLKTTQLDVIGKQIDEVVPNSRAKIVLSTGKAEISQPHTYSEGERSIVHRIPIFDNEGNVRGLLGIILFKSMDELKSLAEINNLLKSRLNAYHNEIRNIYQAKYTFEDIISESKSIQQRKALAKRYAKSDSAVLITGETGTGKELWAHAIHNVSPRREQPFVSLNCAAIPENLFESELFGYDEGAFTGAKKGGKLGKFRLAKDGTLFLDEIGDMPLNMQVKMLRAIQEKEIEKVGGFTEKIDFRIIAATNSNLQEAVQKGKFREDLYYRLNTFSINLPPLRENSEDIGILTKHFITKYCNNNAEIKIIDSKAQESLEHYSWPGNIRELSAVIERLLVSVDSPTIRISDLPESIIFETGLKLSNEKNKLDKLLAQIERECIIRALNVCNNCKSDSARYLGIARSRLYRKMEEYNICTDPAPDK